MSVNCSVRQRKSSALRQSLLRWAGRFLLALAGFCFVSPFTAMAQVPGLLNYQGRISVGTTGFEGTGQFKLALVNSGASQTYWRNAADANNDGEPDASVSVSVSRGLYSLMLGDTSLANMAVLPPGVFTNSAVYLRVWFNDGVGGFQLLTPDQRVSSAGYSLISAAVTDGAVTAPKLGTDVAAQLAALSAQLTTLSNRLNTAEGHGSTAVSSDPQDTTLLSSGYVSFYSTAALDWKSGSGIEAPGARFGHTAIWTGQDMVVWGGYLGSDNYAASGGNYAPTTDSWTPISTFSAPSGRQSHSAVWSGTEMIVWGGFGSGGYVNTGGRYQPSAQVWNSLNASGAPSARSDHACVWTGNRMIVWGGRGPAGYLANGALYDPAANQWTALTVASPPEARHSAVAVWAGTRLIVWGGEAALGPVSSGGRLLVDAAGTPQSWQTTATANAPSARGGHSGIWTGQKLIVWGGRNGSSFLGDGALYDPATDAWTTLPTAGAPSARAGHVALWTGSEMLVFGGEDGNGTVATGAAYDVTANKWRTLNSSGNPTARSEAKAVWSGTELLIFGGKANGQPVAALQRLNPQPAWYFYRKL